MDNATAARLALEQQSRSLLASQMAPSLAVTLVAFPSIITNGLVILTIIKSKALHNKSQYVICSHVVPEFFFAVCTVINSARKVLYATMDWTDTITRVNCMCGLLPLVVSSKAALVAILLLCIDRFLAVTAPITYKILNPVKYIAGLNALCYVWIGVHLPFMFINANPDDNLPICQYALAVPVRFRSYEVSESQAITITTITAYGITIGVVAFRYWNNKWQNQEERANWSRQIQMGAFRMMMVVVLIYLVCWGVGQAISYVLTWYSTPTIAAVAGPYVQLLHITNTASHFFVYFTMSKRFRKAFRQVFSRKSAANSVTNAR